MKVKPRRSVWVARPHRELQNKEPTTLVAQFSMLSLVRQQAQGRQAPSRAPLLVQKRGMRERADKEQVRLHVPSQMQSRIAKCVSQFSPFSCSRSHIEARHAGRRACEQRLAGEVIMVADICLVSPAHV